MPSSSVSMSSFRLPVKSSTSRRVRIRFRARCTQERPVCQRPSAFVMPTGYRLDRARAAAVAFDFEESPRRVVGHGIADTSTNSKCR